MSQKMSLVRPVFILVNALAITAESRYSIAKLAFDENVQHISFYMPLVYSGTEIFKDCYSRSQMTDSSEILDDSKCDVNSNNILHSSL